MSPALLEVKGLQSRYGRIQVLHGIDLQVPKGTLVALVGANGAGKTTLMRCISGVQPIDGGSVFYENQDISAMRPNGRVCLGICQVPEGRQIFGATSVEDNLRLGAFVRKDADAIQQDMESAYEMFPILREYRKLPAGTLSGGQQQMLAMGRALMGQPRLLLLDEPSMGLAPLVVAEIFRVIRDLRERGTTILLVEQNARAALSIADYGYVMETGHVTITGTGQELLANGAVQAAYLGA